MSATKINAIMQHYETLAENDAYDWIRWKDARTRFSKKTANRLFIGVMLDQGQKAERAWNAAEYLVDNYFNTSEDFWGDIATTHLARIKKICQTGYVGKSFALNYSFNKFPRNLKSSAKLMIEKYGSDPRNIWNVRAENVYQIYDRFLLFPGIGDALAKMAQFALVKNHGVAGGISSKSEMSIKPDILVRRVLRRVGLVSSGQTYVVVAQAQEFGLSSPADFDAAVWVIGREFCFKSVPACNKCPIALACDSASV